MKAISNNGIVLLYLLLFCLCIGCTSNIQNKQFVLESFLRREYIPIGQYAECADSVFNCEFVLGQDSELFVYVFDSSCSSCVLGTLDFMATLNSLDSPVPRVIFFSKSDNDDVFTYYFEKSAEKRIGNKSVPRYYHMYDRNDVPNGLYSIEGGMIKSYMPW